MRWPAVFGVEDIAKNRPGLLNELRLGGRYDSAEEAAVHLKLPLARASVERRCEGDVPNREVLPDPRGCIAAQSVCHHDRATINDQSSCQRFGKQAEVSEGVAPCGKVDKHGAICSEVVRDSVDGAMEVREISDPPQPPGQRVRDTA